MLKRKIEKELDDWFKNDPGRALYISGPRQTGKTTAVREFARRHFECFVELDFQNDAQARAVFENGRNTGQILRVLENFKEDIRLIPGKTLILFDEVQECPEARTAVKFLVEEGSYRYIETASLPRFRLTEIRSIPVGFERVITMNPLTFEEFLWASGISQEAIDRLEESFQKREPVPADLHEQMLNRFRTYLAVGGMPEAVESFIKKGSLQDVQPILDSIWNLYEADIIKYSSTENRSRILEIFRQVPGQLNNPDHRFSFKQDKKGTRTGKIPDCFSWLSQEGMTLPCLNTTVPQIPLLLNEKRNQFRLYLPDTGLLVSRISNTARKFLQNDSDLNWSAVLENAAAQTLRANGFELHYFQGQKTGEIDFLINEEDEISLIEMKAGQPDQKYPALDKVRRTENWKFRNSYVFCTGNVEVTNGIIQMPWYLMMFLRPYRDLSDIVFYLEPL